jgi:uncharacterized cofD-like protein
MVHDRESQSSSETRIVSIGGGTGLSTLLRGLKRHPVELAAIVAVTDDGGSSGRLREELGVLPPGDIRNCMMALSEDEGLMARLFRHRFSSASADGGLHGHSFGNLFLTAMAEVTGDFAKAVRLTSEVLAIKGTIYPSTTSNVSLKAQFEDGQWVHGETRITADDRTITRLELDPPGAHSVPESLEAIAVADIVTLGPGSLYTSLIANLLPQEMCAALENSPARKIYIQNIMTQPAETANMSTADHVAALATHCGRTLFHTVLVNNRPPSEHILSRYSEEKSHVVEVDRERLADMDVEVVERDLLSEDRTIRHDPDRLAETVLELAVSGTSKAGVGDVG